MRLARLAVLTAAAAVAEGAATGCRLERAAAPAAAVGASAASVGSFPSPCAALPPLSLDSVPAGREFFVSAAAARGGDGSAERPWDLATALASPAAVRAGDTIWLAAGVYRGTFVSRLTGSRDRPVVVRGRPGRVALDGDGAHDPVLTVEGGFTLFRDFEIFNSRPSSDADSSNLVSRGPGTRFVDLVIHDASSTGIGLWSEAPDSEVAGCVIFANGRHANLDHGIYTQNRTGSKAIRDNVIIRSRAYGLHIYGSSTAALRGYCIEGNVLLDNGALVPGSGHSNAIIGGSAPTEDIELADNHFIESESRNTNVRLGYGGVARNLSVRNNRFFGGDPAVFVDGWSGALLFERNTLAGSGVLAAFRGEAGGSASWKWNANVYWAGGSGRPFRWGSSGERFDGWREARGFDGASELHEGLPGASEVFLRRNPYEAGRARILVYNPAHKPSVDVDLSSILPSGSSFDVVNAEDVLGPPVLSGRYAGGAVTIPLAPGRRAKPIGLPEAGATPAPGPPPASVFLLRRAEGAR